MYNIPPLSQQTHPPLFLRCSTMSIFLSILLLSVHRSTRWKKTIRNMKQTKIPITAEAFTSSTHVVSGDWGELTHVEGAWGDCFPTVVLLLSMSVDRLWWVVRRVFSIVVGVGMMGPGWFAYALWSMVSRLQRTFGSLEIRSTLSSAQPRKSGRICSHRIIVVVIMKLD